MRQLSANQYKVIWVTLFIVFLLPCFAFVVAAFKTPDPVEFLTGETGEFALRLLLLTLMITPLQQLSGWLWPIRLRRMIGLYAFFYALFHFLVYVILDAQFDVPYIIDDVIQRQYITVGFLAFLLLIPLAITSNNRLIRKLGAKNWSLLHKTIYIITPLVIVHLIWQQRGEDLAEAIIYSVLVGLLLFVRLPFIRLYLKNFRKFNKK